MAKTSGPGGRGRGASAASDTAAKRSKKGKGGGKGGDKGKGKGKKKGGKPCDCSKDTSRKNKKNVNKKKRDGTKRRCNNRSCRKTAAQWVASHIRRKKLTGAAADYWKGYPLEADHKFPADKIKKLKGFAELETKDLRAARKIMTLQSNIQPLCRSCNGRKGAGGKFEGDDVKEALKLALEKFK